MDLVLRVWEGSRFGRRRRGGMYVAPPPRGSNPAAMVTEADVEMPRVYEVWKGSNVSCVRSLRDFFRWIYYLLYSGSQGLRI